MKILAIELGTWSLKAVEIESRFRMIDILDFYETRLPIKVEDPVAAYRDAIAGLFAKLPSPPERIIVSVPPSHTAVRFLNLPIRSRKQVEKTFKFELEDGIPFRLEDSIIEHDVTKTKEGSQVFAAITPKKLAASYLEWLKSIGLDPDWITFEGAGVINLFTNYVGKEAVTKNPQPILLLDIGNFKTNLSIFHEGRIEMFRSISWGGAAITSTIASSLGVSTEEAEQLKIDYAKMRRTTGEKEIGVAIQEALNGLLSDLNQTLIAYRNQSKKDIVNVLVTGGSSCIAELRETLSIALAKPIEEWNPLAGYSIKTDLSQDERARFGEVLGRGLICARKAPIQFNFRQQELGKETSLREVSEFLQNESVQRLGVYGGVLAGMLFLHVTIAHQLASQEEKKATEELKKVFAQTFNNVPQKVRNTLTGNAKELRKFVDGKNKELETKLKLVAKGKQPSLSLIKSISDSFPYDVKVDVNSLQFDERSFLMEGVLYSGELNRVTDLLKKVASFNNVNVSRAGQRFTYKGDLVGK